MTEDYIIAKIQRLSGEEKKLLSLKLKELVLSGALKTKNQKKLVAYVKEEEVKNTEDLKSYLKNKIPDYMIPSNIYRINEFPVLPNGKIDRIKLQDVRVKNSHAYQNSATDHNQPKNEIEEKLICIWEEVLGFSPIRINDNFFEIGGDSILSIQIISKAQKAGIDLKANHIFENQTILGLSKRLTEDKKSKKSWNFMAIIRKEGIKKPLFCVHSGGGHVFIYTRLKKYLKTNRPIYAIQPPGLYDSKEMHHTIEGMTKEYLKAIRVIQPHGPYNILVYCFSTSVGNEMAIQLDKIDEEINIIVADTMAAAWNVSNILSFKTRFTAFSKRFSKNPYLAIKKLLERRSYLLTAIKGKYLGDPQEKQLEKLKSNLRRMSLDYTWKKNNGKVSLILTDKPERSDKNYNNFVIKSWEKFAKGGVKVYHTKGNHISLFEEPDIEFVANQIDKCLID